MGDEASSDSFTTVVEERDLVRSPVSEPLASFFRGAQRMPANSAVTSSGRLERIRTTWA